MLRSVDFPQPDSPAMATHSPRATWRSTASRRGTPGEKDFASPRTSSTAAGSGPGDDAENGAAEGAQRRSDEEPALLGENGDRGERDGDLQQRHGDGEKVVRVQRLRALLVPALVCGLVLPGVLLDVLRLGGVALRLGLVELDR